MAESVVLNAKARDQLGTHVARRMRKHGLVPAVIYGHKEESVSISVSNEELTRAIRHGARIIELKHGEKSETTMFRDVQWDPLGIDILHVDFYRVSANETVKLEVPVLVRGNAPGVTAGGLLVQSVHALEVECIVTNIPESIRINVSELQLEQVIHVRDLKLPEGVTVMADPDVIVVQVVKKATDEEATAPIEQVEPEVIGRKKEDEEAAE